MAFRFGAFRQWVLVGTLAVAGASVGCATTGVGEVQSEFIKTGEVIVSLGRQNGSAAFDANRVVGPQVNLSRRSDGSWGGQLNGEFYSFTLSPGRLSSANFVLNYEETASGLTMKGHIQGRMFRFEVDNEQLLMHTGDGRALTLPRMSDELFGSDGKVRLEGEAGSQNPPMPQLAFALLSAFGA
jgi:hypothetical protein